MDKYNYLGGKGGKNEQKEYGKTSNGPIPKYYYDTWSSSDECFCTGGAGSACTDKRNRCRSSASGK